MHRRIRLSLPVRILAATLLSASARAADPAADNSVGHVAAANTAFAIDLYRQLAAAPGNLFFSPYSLSRVLAMAAVGARGPTATGMTAALHLGTSTDQVADGYAGLTKALQENAGDDVTLVTADSLWVQNQFPLLDSYLRIVRGQFGAEAMPADFVHNAEGARSTINGWVSEQTHGKITELIGSGVVDAMTRVVLCDAIYFKGKWAGPFEAAQTRPEPFYLTPAQGVMVPTMHRTDEVRTTDNDGVRLLELPYWGGSTSMVILLPDAEDGLAAVERQLADQRLVTWLAQLAIAPKIEVSLALPRFLLTDSHDLGDRLRALGMTAAFDPSAADFSGMTGDRSLALSRVLHKAVVDVNEEGTEAAAASGGIITLGVMMPIKVRVDHPFLFLIRDNATGTILFLGRVVDPR